MFQLHKIKTIEDVKSSKAFCMKPWNHLYVSLFGKVTPCCLAAFDDTYAFGDIEAGFEQVWNGEKMRQFRLDMLADRPNFRCHQCYSQESMGLKSPRLDTNELYAHHLPWAIETKPDGTSPNAKPVTWDLRISNLCNLKCRICGHHSSSRWFKDAKKLGFERNKQSESVWHDKAVNRGVKDFDKLMQQLEYVIPTLEEIYFAGGEPLIMEEHYLILHKLLEYGRTDVYLRYNTNFSQLTHGGENVLDLWSKFQRVAIYASLDDSGDRGEYQRSGINWKKIENNRKEMLQKCPNVEFAISATVSVFNIQHLPDYHKDWLKRGLIKPNGLVIHVLMNPPQYSITIFPKKTKDRTAQKIEEYINWLQEYAISHPNEFVFGSSIEHIASQWRGVITYMYSEDNSPLIPQFIDISCRLDKIRHENTETMFPELKELWE